MTKTHWKKLRNPDYIGAYAFDPGEEKVVTVAAVKKEMVVGADGKKEECTVMHFSEAGVKPMIVNATNAKTCEKLYKTPYIEEWTGRKLQLYVAQVKAFGDVVDAVRIRPTLPREQASGPIKCDECEHEVQASGGMAATQIVALARKRFGRTLCMDCAQKLKAVAEAQKADDEDTADNEGIADRGDSDATDD